MYKYGISLSINTDGRTISDTDMNKEYALLNKYFNWNKKEFFESNIHAINASFSSTEVKERMIIKLNDYYLK